MHVQARHRRYVILAHRSSHQIVEIKRKNADSDLQTKTSVHESLYKSAAAKRDRIAQKAQQLHLEECPFEPATNKASNDLNKSFDNFLCRNKEFVDRKNDKIRELEERTLLDEDDGLELFRPRLLHDSKRRIDEPIEVHLQRAGEEYEKRRQARVEEIVSQCRQNSSPLVNADSVKILAGRYAESFRQVFRAVDRAGSG